MLVGLAAERLSELASKLAIPGWIMFGVGVVCDVWWIVAQISTGQSVYEWMHSSRSIETHNASDHSAWIALWHPSSPLVPTLLLFAGLLWLTLLLCWPSSGTSSGSLMRRTRLMVKKLNAFTNANEGNFTAIHFLYDANFRTPVDKLFSELAAAEVCDILEGDWVINPQVQTVKNIRENVIAQLTKSADRLEAKQSAPRSKLVGELEAGKFTVFGDGFAGGVKTPTTNLCLKLRVTNKEPRQVTLKRASLRITFDGETYRGIKTSLWYPTTDEDFMELITDKTPIRQAIATTGLLEFTIAGLKRPDRAVAADVSVALVDEFEVLHTIRNKQLWITV